jgi:hypothetical protein
MDKGLGAMRTPLDAERLQARDHALQRVQRMGRSGSPLLLGRGRKLPGYHPQDWRRLDMAEITMPRCGELIRALSRF